ncbi:hypothetical protein MCOR25_010874 [Pyricularia grisea]|nr:hypothetical protein MCOR25_010874 [Pyricularia grisea]
MALFVIGTMALPTPNIADGAASVFEGSLDDVTPRLVPRRIGDDEDEYYCLECGYRSFIVENIENHDCDWEDRYNGEYEWVDNSNDYDHSDDSDTCDNDEEQATGNVEGDD